MADPARFPDLTLPFAITGAAAGWFSRGLFQHPALKPPPAEPRIVTALVAAVLAAATGRLLTRWCAGRRYGYQIDTPDPAARLPTDRWPRHIAALLVAGLLTGAIAGALSRPRDVFLGLLLGVLCTTPYLLVFAAILSVARRAQRSRPGSIVAGSDRRAVWGVLATSLAVATLESALDWFSPEHVDLSLDAPHPVILLLGLCTICIPLMLALDALALARVSRAIAPGLAPREDARPAADDGAPRLDLGLGDTVHHTVARTGSVYRARERAVAIVEGDPREAVAALRGALRRGAWSVAVVLGIIATHAAMTVLRVPVIFYEQQRCALGSGEGCYGAARRLQWPGPLSPDDRRDVIALHQRACDQRDGRSCVALAELYKHGDGVHPDMAVVAHYEYRAAQLDLCPWDSQLVRRIGFPNACFHLEAPAPPLAHEWEYRKPR